MLHYMNLSLYYQECNECYANREQPLEFIGIIHHSSRFVLDRHGPKGNLCVHKEWAAVPEPYVYQTSVADITAHAPEYQEKSITLDSFFPPKTQCFVMSPPHYGSLAEVQRDMFEVSHKQAWIRLCDTYYSGAERLFR